MSAPLLQLDDVRIDFEGRCVLESMTLATSGERVGLLGKGRFVFEAISGAADVVSGIVRIRGIELEEARQGAGFAVARPWPARANVTLREGLIGSALLGGCTTSVARTRADAALELLGISSLSGQKLVRRPKVEQYLAGLAEAALFDPDVLIVDWPVGALDAEGWVRFGTAMSRLISHKAWLAWVPGPARLPVENAWIGALDQMLWIESGLCAEYGIAAPDRVKTLVVIDKAIEELADIADEDSLRMEPIRMTSALGERRAAFLVDLPRDEFGRVDTEQLLVWCDRHGLPVFRMEPLDRGF